MNESLTILFATVSAVLAAFAAVLTMSPSPSAWRRRLEMNHLEYAHVHFFPSIRKQFAKCASPAFEAAYNDLFATGYIA